MQKKTTILILIIVIILLLIGGGVYWWWGNQEKEPKNSLETVDYIQIKETPEGKIVENTKEGISMKVPEGWEVNKKADYGEEKVLEIWKTGLNQYAEDFLQDGVDLCIYIYKNPNHFTLQEWIENEGWTLDKITFDTIDNKELIQIETKFPEGLGENDETIYREDSKIKFFYFLSGDKIYKFACTSMGVNYEENAKMCEALVKEKIQNLPWIPIINLEKAKVGDKIGKLTIESIMPFSKKHMQDSAERIEEFLPFGYENFSIVFTGETLMKGSYQFYGENEPFVFNEVCIQVKEAIPMIPIIKINGEIVKSDYFCFSNQELARKLFFPQGSSGEAEVIVDSYEIVSYPSEVWNIANLVKVVKKY